MATLPRKMLVHRATLIVPAGVTIWQDSIGGQRMTMYRVHIQRQSGTNVNSINTEVQTQAVLWFDSKISSPHGLNLLNIKAQCEQLGAGLFVDVDGHMYSVTRVVECLDGYGHLHHYEVEMI